MKGGIMYKRGDVVFVPFPYSSLYTIKFRPALIISNSSYKSSQDVIICPITSNLLNNGIIIAEDDFKVGSIPFKSQIKPEYPFAIKVALIKKRFGTLKNKKVNEVVKQLIDSISD
jgi:mRNA interferase MazF